jgi:hypothetical protein
MLHGFTLALTCPEFYTYTNINENYTLTWDVYQKTMLYLHNIGLHSAITSCRPLL